MAKIYKRSIKTIIFLVAALLFILWASVTSYQKGDFIIAYVGFLFSIIGLLAIFLFKQYVYLDDKAIELRTEIPLLKFRRSQRAEWEKIRKVYETHFWDIIKIVLIIAYDEKKMAERLHITLAMFTDFKNYKELLDELLKRVPTGTDIMDNVKKWAS